MEIIVHNYICKCKEHFARFDGTPNEPCPKCGLYVPIRYSHIQDEKCNFIRSITQKFSSH